MKREKRKENIESTTGERVKRAYSKQQNTPRRRAAARRRKTKTRHIR